MIIIGLFIGIFLAHLLPSVEDSNLTAPAMLIMALGINVATILIGIVTGFYIAATIRKLLREQKVNDYLSRNIFRDKFDSSRPATFLITFICTFVTITLMGNVPTIVTLLLTLALLIDTVINYFTTQKPDKETFYKMIVSTILIFCCAVVTVTRINSLNIFVLFYGFITIPAYIFPKQTTSKTSIRDGSVKGLAYALETKSVIARGFILGQAIAANSQRDAIGTIINAFVGPEVKIFLFLAIVVIFCIYYCSKELEEYLNTAPISVEDNRPNKVFALLNILLGGFIAVTQFNPLLFVIITFCGITCAALIQSNDTLRALCVPNLLVAGLIFG